jgi:ribonuclease HII
VDVPQNCFNKGDGINFSIAAASIVAKTHRDRLMDELACEYPEYGFERHKGYSTPEHQEAIRRHGPCAIHRKSFTFIRELCGEYSARFYDLKQRLYGAATPAELEAAGEALAAALDSLAEHEQRKLKLVLSRRWKLV